LAVPILADAVSSSLEKAWTIKRCYECRLCPARIRSHKNVSHAGGFSVNRFAMQCPACDRKLNHVLAGDVEVDACEGGCGGIWFDAFEMQKLDQPEEKAGELLLNISRDPAVTVDLERRRSCPRCDGIVMLRHSHKNSESVVIDECPGCGGFWLDAGELAMIRESYDAVTEKRKHTQTLLEELKMKSLAELNTDKHKQRHRTITTIHGFFSAWPE